MTKNNFYQSNFRGLNQFALDNAYSKLSKSKKFLKKKKLKLNMILILPMVNHLIHNLKQAKESNQDLRIIFPN